MIVRRTSTDSDANDVSGRDGMSPEVGEELPPPCPYSTPLYDGCDCLLAPNRQLALEAEPLDKPLASTITVVVCTSPIPSHPSSALLEATLESFALCSGDLQQCRTVVVCDGCTIDEANPHSKWGRVTQAQSCDYDAFKIGLRRKAACSAAQRFEVIELASHHGFARAVLAAVESTVRTELCLVVQHDWLFVSPGFDAVGAAEAMLKHKEVLPYVGAMSLSTVGYRERAMRRYGVDIEPAVISVGSLRFLPLVMLQDKPFLAQRQWLCDLCSATPMGKFPEDTVGQRQLNAVRAHGLQERAVHRLHRTYVLDQAAPVTYHLSGRKVRAGTSGVDSCTTSVAMQALPRGANVLGTGFVRGAVFGHAAVAGLAARETDGDAKIKTPLCSGGHPVGQPARVKRFKGRCFICGKKGHSKAHCPTIDLPETCKVAQAGP